jgi:hypothetical protein
MKKYTIELYMRGHGIHLIPLSETEIEELLNLEDLEEPWYERANDPDDLFAHYGFYYTRACDRFGLAVRDEDGVIIYETEEMKELLCKDRTKDEEGKIISGWKWIGIDSGVYLTRISTVKGLCYEGEIELEEPFDADKLYVVQNRNIPNTILQRKIYSLADLFYIRGEECDLEDDVIEMYSECTESEQYWDTYICEITHGIESDEWDTIR